MCVRKASGLSAGGFTGVLLTTVLLLSACVSLPAGPNNAAKATATPMYRSGIAELDAITAIVLAGNTSALRSMLAFTRTHCTFAEGLGGPPKCLAGEPEGAPVEVLPFLGPEGHFVRKADIESWEGLDVSELFAVYQVSDTAYSDANYPAGEYAIVFIDDTEAKASITLQVEKGRIVRIDYGFGTPPGIRQDDVVKYLVPPANTKP
jgi:hypothetical protein